jgi:uncharacterized protein YjdB
LLPTLKLRRIAFAIITAVGTLTAACADSTDPGSQIHKTPVTAGYGRPASVQIAAPATLEEGTSASLSCLVMDPRGLILDASKSWQVSDTSVMAVSAAGTLVARRPGQSLVTCSADAFSATAAVGVTESPVDFVEVTPGGAELGIGNRIQLVGVPRDVTGAPVSNHPVQWSIDNAGIAAISSTGTVTTYAEGTTTITAKSGSKTGTVTLGVSASPAPAASISVSVYDGTVNIGQITRAEATVLDAAGHELRNRSIVWSVADPSIVTVTTKEANKAAVIGRQSGSTTITATVEGISASVGVKVAPPAVLFVSVTLDPSSLYTQRTSQATATLRDAGRNLLSDRPVTWTSMNTSVATVTPTGLVTAVSPGTAYIRATSESQSGDALLTVMASPTPVAAVKNVIVALTSSTITQGQQAQAYAIVTDSTGAILNGQNVTWSSTDASIATVSSSGLVTGRSTGSSKIRASVQTKTGEATQTVTSPTQPVATVSTTATSTTLAVGQTTQATAVAKDLNGLVLTGRTVTWSSLNPGIATVSPTGLVTAVAIGTATIRATIESKPGDVVVTVSPPAVASVSCSLAPASVSVGQTTQANADAKDAAGNVLTGRAFTWSSSNPSIATVSPSGLVTAVGTGSVTIRATADGVSGDAALSVGTAAPVPVATVTVTLAAPGLTAGQTTQASAVAKDANGNTLTGRTISWSSLNPAVATVSSTGLVTAVAVGQATVRATIDSKTGDAALAVTAPVGTVASVTVTLNSSSLLVGQSAQASAVARDASGNILTGKSVTWTSMNPSIAAIAASGLVTALAAGSATVRATVDGKTGDGAVSVASQTVSSGPITPPELPRAYVTTAYPTVTGTSRSVPAGGDLQAALNAAVPGDEIVLAPGATYVGNFVWPAKACTAYTVIRTGGADSDFPPDGSRMTPSYAPKLAKIITPNVAPAMAVADAACKLWISRVEITGTPQGSGVDYNYGLVRFGGGETTLAALPSDLVLDRVYLHGSSSVSVQHGVVFNGIRNAIVNSWCSDVHWPGTETHCISGWAGPGPFKIVNNYLEAASINVLFGGAPPSIPGVHPADIEIRQNHFFKPLSYIGKGYAVKNLLEFKHGLRILVEDNIFENSWADAQIGYAINMFSGGDSNPPGGLAQTADVTFRYNIVRNAQLAFNLPANPYQSASPVTRVAIENNLFEKIGPVGPNDTEAKGFQLLDNLSNVRVAHNTLLRTSVGGAPFIIGRDAGVAAASNIAILDNLMGVAQPYGAVFGNGVGTDALNGWAGTSWQFSNNVLWQSAVATGDSRAPAGNFWPLDQTDVGFAADWSLLPSSPYKGKASDGTDPGANITALRQRTANVP